MCTVESLSNLSNPCRTCRTVELSNCTYSLSKATVELGALAVECCQQAVREGERGRLHGVHWEMFTGVLTPRLLLTNATLTYLTALQEL